MKRHLPVMTGATCDRRQLLVGLGLGALLAGCRMSLDRDPVPVAEDVVMPPDSGTEPAGATLCEQGVCLDLAHPDNVALVEIDGFRVLVVGSKRVIVVRTSDSSFIALSAACTHAGTTVRYDPNAMDLVCPNHGSRFALDGEVTVGPAELPLSTFQTTYDPAADTLVIAL